MTISARESDKRSYANTPRRGSTSQLMPAHLAVPSGLLHTPPHSFPQVSEPRNHYIAPTRTLG
jgi:hypothetical protein